MILGNDRNLIAWRLVRERWEDRRMVRKDATGKASESLQLLSEASLASLDSFSNSTEDSVKDSGLLSVVSS